MGSGHAGKGMGKDRVVGQVGVHADDDRFPDESDLAQDLKGKNKLQGNDQRNTHNQRYAMPDEAARPEGVIESFEHMDPKKRV
jgi:hypothetical protein